MKQHVLSKSVGIEPPSSKFRGLRPPSPLFGAPVLNDALNAF